MYATVTNMTNYNDATTETKQFTVKTNVQPGTLTLSATSGTTTTTTSTYFTYTSNHYGSETASSSNTDIATVYVNKSLKRVYVYGIRAGTATITVTNPATTGYTEATATFTVTVNKTVWARENVLYDNSLLNDYSYCGDSQFSNNDGGISIQHTSQVAIYYTSNSDGDTVPYSYYSSRSVAHLAWYIGESALTGHGQTIHLDGRIKYSDNSWGDGSQGKRHVVVYLGGTKIVDIYPIDEEAVNEPISVDVVVPDDGDDYDLFKFDVWQSYDDNAILMVNSLYEK